MQYYGGPVFVFGKFHVFWCSSEHPGGCWNSTFKWRSAESAPIALNSFVFRLTLYKDLNKNKEYIFPLPEMWRRVSSRNFPAFHRNLLTSELVMVAAGFSDLLAKVRTTWGKASYRLRQRANKRNKNRVGRLPTSERNRKIILSYEVRRRIGKG
jgi:hypothetical protein